MIHQHITGEPDNARACAPRTVKSVEGHRTVPLFLLIIHSVPDLAGGFFIIAAEDLIIIVVQGCFLQAEIAQDFAAAAAAEDSVLSSE